MFRRRRERDPVARVDVAGLDPRWRTAVEETVAAQQRFLVLVAQSPPGPVREHLGGLADRISAGVVAAWETASRAGQAASRTLAGMAPDEVQDRLKDARRRLARAHETNVDTTALRAEVDLLAEQHAALNHLSNGVEDAAERLRLLDLRLDAAVARAAAIALRPDALEQLGSVDHELNAVVDELAALSAGLDAVGG